MATATKCCELWMSDVGLPQSFDCEGVYVNHNGHLALRRGPRDMLSHILKTNVIAVQKLVGLLTSETGCRWRCETRRPRFATQSSDAFILNACAHCLALQMIFFSSPPQGSDDFCKVLRKQLVTQLNCGNHASCKEPRNTTRCSFYRGGRNKN